MLAVLAAASVLGSALPPVAAWPVAAIAFAHGLILCRRELRRPECALAIPGGNRAASLAGVPVAALAVQWRGPLAFVQWRDCRGRLERRQGWPDTMSGSARRELRLAMISRATAPATGSVAP